MTFSIEIVFSYLELVSRETAVVPKDLVVAGPARPLDALVAQEVEVPFGGVVDALVHHGACQGIAILVLVVVQWEEPE